MSPGGEDVAGGPQPCTVEDSLPCHQICIGGQTVARECGFDGACDSAADPLPDCDETEQCTDAGLCEPSDECAEDGDCEPTVGDDGHIQVCVPGDGRLVCAVGCRNDAQCRPADAPLPWVCQSPELGTTDRRCEACDCQTDVDCDGFGQAGQLYACGADPGKDCKCAAVDCRPGFADCDDGEVCNARAYQCESQTCRVHEDCADEHKHCKRDPGDETGVCVCGDNRSTGECEPDDCRATGQCQEWDEFGETFICLDWNCLEQPCNGDDDCEVLGTECGDGDPQVCIPQSCTTDEECPRRRDIVPRPSGVFYCDGAPAPGSKCEPGCRDDTDCDETHKCVEHACVQRSCAGPGDCEQGRWCNADAQGAPENAGLCEEGCDELGDCPQDQPCRLDRNACGCVLDADCAIIDADKVCTADGTCGNPCRGHEDCAGDEACIDGHCFEGACRNDLHEANDNRDDAFEFFRGDCDGEDFGCLLPCEDDPGNLCGTFIPRFCSEPPPHPDLTPDVADWFRLPLNRFEEVEIVVTWPLVDSVGDGWGDAPGACNLDAADLSGTTSLFRSGEDNPDVLAREWPRPQWVFEPPGPNQPCRMTVNTHVPAPRNQDYWLAIENFDATRFDYGLEVKLQQALVCEPDPWENNDVHGNARGIFDCAAFIIQGGHLGQVEDVGDATFCENDSDWYEISLRPGDRTRVRITYDNRLGELRARLRPPADIVDPAVNLILEDVVGQDGVLELTEDDEQDSVAEGNYLLEVTQGSQANLGIPVQMEYNIEIACEGPAVPCQDDGPDGIFERNDVQGDAICIRERRNDNDVIECPPIPANDGRPYVWQYPDANEEDAVPLHLCANGQAPDLRDEDWYKFQVDAGGQVNVLMENDLGPGNVWFLEVELQDAGGEVLRASRNAAALNSFNEVGLAAGFYYIRVKHPNNVLDERTVPYSLTITVFGAPPLCAEDGFEENDSHETARELPVEPGVEGDDLHCFPVDEDSHLALCAPPPGQGHDEEDWYMVDLTGVVAERIDVQIRCQEGDDLFVELRGEDGLLSCPRNISPDRACRDLSPGCGGGNAPQTMTLRQPRAEEQRIKVFGINDAQNEYDLCVGVVAEICEDDQYENNDVCVQATVHDAEDTPFLNQFFPLESRICPNDDDYYVFRPSQAPGVQEMDEYSVRVLVVMDGDADLDVQLLDKRCNRFNGVLEEDLGLGQEVCLIHDDAAAGDDFFVRVYGADVLGDAGYTVKVDVGPPGALGCL